jgi:hypothetical protein
MGSAICMPAVYAPAQPTLAAAVMKCSLRQLTASSSPPPYSSAVGPDLLSTRRPPTERLAPGGRRSPNTVTAIDVRLEQQHYYMIVIIGDSRARPSYECPVMSQPHWR